MNKEQKSKLIEIIINTGVLDNIGNGEDIGYADRYEKATKIAESLSDKVVLIEPLKLPTNEEWLSGLPTYQKAREMQKQVRSSDRQNIPIDMLINWLLQPHKADI